MQRLVANDALETHENVGKCLGAIQNAKGNIPNPIVEIGITEGYLQALATGTVKMYCNIQKTNVGDVIKFIDTNPQFKNFRHAFIQYSSIEKPGYLRQFFGWVKKLY